MADERYEFCKMFLKEQDSRIVDDLLTNLLGTRSQLGVRTLSEAGVDIRKNPDAGTADDFIGWPTIIEIEARADASNTAVVDLATKILNTMWDADIPTVVACDYEDELPWRGGIGRVEDHRED